MTFQQLEARITYGKSKVKEWEKRRGFQKRALQDDGEYKQLPYSDFAADYCVKFNRSPPKYRLITDNCQLFVRNFLGDAALEDSLEKLPETAIQSKENFFKVEFGICD